MFLFLLLYQKWALWITLWSIEIANIASGCSEAPVMFEIIKTSYTIYVTIRNGHNNISPGGQRFRTQIPLF